MAVTPRERRATRIIAIGDLNGADDVLVDILRRTRLMNNEGGWIGGRAHLVQVGDLFNRGGGAKAALRCLGRLKLQARAAGGEVTTLLGNHEVMTVLRHEAYCTEQEYLSFATKAQRASWPHSVQKATIRLLRPRSPRGAIEPLQSRLEAWKIAHVPGKASMRRTLGPRGALGKVIRHLPLACESHGLLFVHSGVLPRWAELGVQGLNKALHREWLAAPAYFWKLPRSSLFRSRDSPLWDRQLALGGAAAGREIRRSLRLLGLNRMIVGHTRTEAAPGGKRGRIHTRHGGRLVMIDVGLSSGRDTPRAALIVQGNRGWEWTPQGRTLLWHDG